MANGTYGTKRPAQITADDVDIFYSYRPNRSSDDANFIHFKKINAISVLSQSSYQNENGTNSFVLPGMYDLRLPVDEFSEKGIYTIYIKPKEIFTTIKDGDARLAAYPNVRGIIIDTSSNSELMGELSNNGNLVGYRIEYYDDNNEPDGTYRIITSSNKCEPLMQNLNDSSQKGVRYRFNDSSNLIFCTLTPSSSLSFKSNSIPNIGKTSQRISLVNTKFNPIAIEIEMVEHDADTISTMLEGTQIRNLNKGIITTFNQEGGIYHQADYGNITNISTGINHDFKVQKTDNISYEEEDRLEEIKNNI